MTLLALPRYGWLGASSRVRLGQFLPTLAAAGIHVDVSPLLDDAYVRRYNAGQPRDRRALAAAFARRLAVLAQSSRHDLVWIEKELLPMVPASAERALLRGRPYVLDYDDATFHTYDLHPDPRVRRWLGRKIDRLMRGAALVVVGNEYLARRAHQAGARRVEVLPSVVDVARYGPLAPEHEGPFTIGWIGSPGSEQVLEAFRETALALTARPGIRLVLVGASARALPGVPHETWPWSEATEVEAMRAFHVGIMPLPDSPWERGKCGFKLIQCMAVGRAVVASPVGANAEIVVNGVTGVLAGSPPDWNATLTRLHVDAAFRTRIGAAGRARVESMYSLSVVAPRLSELLQSFQTGDQPI